MTVLLDRLRDALRARRGRVGAVCAIAALGLLLWARLIVVSNMPRMAIAEDEGEPVAAHAAPTPDNAPRIPAPETGVSPAEAGGNGALPAAQASGDDNAAFAGDRAKSRSQLAEDRE